MSAPFRPRASARRALAVLLIAALVLTAWLLSPPVPVRAELVAQGAELGLVSFSPVDSLSVELAASQPSLAAGQLRVARQPAALSYLHFQVTGVGSLVVRRATLRLYALDTSPTG